MYFVALFVLTMKRQIKHMIKYKYVPFSFGKARYKGATRPPASPRHPTPRHPTPRNPTPPHATPSTYCVLTLYITHFLCVLRANCVLTACSLFA